MYCFQPDYIGLCAIFFSLIVPIFYMRLQLLVVFGHRGTPDNIFESGGGGIDFPLTPEPGLSIIFVGMGLILLGVFIGMNNQNRKVYLIPMMPIGTLIGLIYLLSRLN